MLYIYRQWRLNDRCVHCQQSGSDERRTVTVRGRSTAKINVCGEGGEAKRSPQKVRDKGGHHCSSLLSVYLGQVRGSRPAAVGGNCGEITGEDPRGLNAMVMVSRTKFGYESQRSVTFFPSPCTLSLNSAPSTHPALRPHTHTHPLDQIIKQKKETQFVG